MAVGATALTRAVVQAGKSAHPLRPENPESPISLKEYGLNFKGLHIMIVKLYSLIKGSWALWEARPEPTTSATPRIAVQMVLHGLDRAL